MNLEEIEAPDVDTIIPREGWHVIHLFYHIEQSQWALYSEEDKLEAKTDLAELVQEIRSSDSTQLLTFSIVTPKADIGFLLVTEDLHRANEFEKRLSIALGPDILSPTYSYLSLTENLDSGTLPCQDMLYPSLPDWPVFCFYPLSLRHRKNRSDSEGTPEPLASHASLIRERADSIQLLITGSAGLDDHDWGVSLFSHNTQNIREALRQMRAEEQTVGSVEPGDFLIGLQLPLDELFRRVGL